MAGGHFERLAGKHVTGPGAGKARHFDRVDACAVVNGFFGAGNQCVHWSTGRVVSAGDVHFDIAEAMLGEMRFERGRRFRSFHIGHKAQIHFRNGASGQNGFPAGAGVTGDESFDIYCRLRNEKLQRFLETDVVHPVLDAHRFHHVGFIQPLRRVRDHFLFRVAEGACLVGEALNRGSVSVGRDERGERFDEMPSGTVEPRFIA